MTTCNEGQLSRREGSKVSRNKRLRYKRFLEQASNRAVAERVKLARDGKNEPPNELWAHHNAVEEVLLISASRHDW